MAKLKRKVLGLDDLEKDLRAIAITVSPQGHLSDALEHGALVILDGAQQNLLRQQLFRSGDLYDSGKVVKINQYRVDVVFDKVYAAIHEFGGIIDVPVTAKSRAYFWWRYRVTGDDKWLAMALSKKTVFRVPIPARPYLRPAIKENKDAALTHVADELRKWMKRAV